MQTEQQAFGDTFYNLGMGPMKDAGEGGHHPDPKHPMYSFHGPSHVVWNAIATVLSERDWSDDQIRDWLQSKQARWAIEGRLGEALTMVASLYAAAIPEDWINHG
jgi:hypothetical protein